MENKPKSSPRAKPKKPTPVSKPETLEEPTNKYAPVAKVGEKKAITQPGEKIIKVGLGKLKTVQH